MKITVKIHNILLIFVGYRTTEAPILINAASMIHNIGILYYGTLGKYGNLSMASVLVFVRRQYSSIVRVGCTNASSIVASPTRSHGLGLY